MNEKSAKWIKRLTILVAIWGILNLLFSSEIFGIVFILFAIGIYFSRNFIVIYALGIILWILGLIQLLSAVGLIHTGFTEGAAKGAELILVAIANFAVGIFIIYKTKKLNN
ncbi:MAG: hypothetical protein ACPK7O_03805 [Methanobacterium sp.]